MVTRNIGLGLNQPKSSCDDDFCPYHGNLTVRGRILTGRVASDKMKKLVTVEKEYLHHIKKYNRYEKRRTKMSAHNPPCIAAVVGDIVTIAECRPITKTISFVVVQKN
jgi:small subunit ribosomal protein S17